MERKTYTIYDNYDVCSSENMESEKQRILEDGIYSEEEITDSMLTDGCYDNDRIWFDDEHEQLENLSEGRLIGIADVGRWNGRFNGYKELRSLECVLNTTCDYEKVYVDSNGDLRKDESHHDGNNHILYRYWKDGLTEEQKENFRDKIYNGKCTQRDITRYTRKAGLKIAECFGWKVRGLKTLTIHVKQSA